MSLDKSFFKDYFKDDFTDSFEDMLMECTNLGLEKPFIRKESTNSETVSPKQESDYISQERI